MSFCFDSNIALYALNAADVQRHEPSRQILAAGLRLGVPMPRQVLGEIFNVANRRKIVAVDAARRAIELMMSRLDVLPTENRHLLEAAALAARYRLQYFDTLIAVIAAGGGARYLLSADMQDGFALPGITIVDPFKDGNRALIETLLTPAPGTA